jgi:hypothetical protein
MYPYRAHKSEWVERATVEVYTVIGRMIQHGCPKGCQRVRYDGVPATKTFAKVQHRMQEAWARVKGIVKGGDQEQCPDDVPPALPAERGAGPLALSPLSQRHGGLAHRAPDLWCDP